ncbi:MAG TPA: sigma-54 dependent transcriptional regulator [Gammaproteobacteria bacterium]|nr:sigma-54 dependent transcriptional regulator [Gammaproteobacteria bacterium]
MPLPEQRTDVPPGDGPEDEAAAPSILVVDDEPDIGNLLQEILEDEGYRVQVAQSGQAARNAMRLHRPDLVLLDIWMPDIDGISLLKEWSDDTGLPMPVIMMSGHGSVETAVEATRLGAYDFIEKPLSLAKLLVTVERALEADRLQRENQGLRRQAHVSAEPIGKGVTMQHLKDQVRRIAQHESWVLMQGEPGSGVRLLARYLHQSSTRREGPFIEVNVAALSGAGAAAELFGSEEGERVHFGLLEQANGGTLLLYDIADMSQELQAKLAGALETKTFKRVGGTEAIKFSVRVIAATHHDLSQRVAEGLFRKDLFYQLNVVPVMIPPLHAHREDVPELLNYYLNLFVNEDKLPYRSFTVAAQNRLRNYHWPGNVRELKNLVQRLLIVGTGPEISLEEVEAALGNVPRPTGLAASIDFDLPLRDSREQFERAYLEHQLRLADGSVVKAAQAAGLERTHLYRKLRALGINPKHLDNE